MGSFRRVALGSAEEGPAAPELRGISGWINTDPITLEALRGKVVLLEIWTFGCVNCVRTIPFLRELYERYRNRDVEFVGVHTPEFDFERDPQEVRAACERLGVVWPVALDNGYETWKAYGNRFWPHVYLIDRRGNLRAGFIGEGHEHEIDAVVAALLAETGGAQP